MQSDGRNVFFRSDKFIHDGRRENPSLSPLHTRLNPCRLRSSTNAICGHIISFMYDWLLISSAFVSPFWIDYCFLFDKYPRVDYRLASAAATDLRFNQKKFLPNADVRIWTLEDSRTRASSVVCERLQSAKRRLATRAGRGFVPH